MKLGTFYPTAEHAAAAESFVRFVTTNFDADAVLLVNYRGSSGYGRAYHRALNEQWGIYDADDAVSGARHLARQGLVDADKMVVMGGSAGGSATGAWAAAGSIGGAAED